MDGLQRYATCFGLPLDVYAGKHRMYRSSTQEEQLAGIRTSDGVWPACCLMSASIPKKDLVVDRSEGSRFLCYHLAVFPYVDRCPIHLGRFPSCFGGSTKGASNRFRKGFRLLLPCYFPHGPSSNRSVVH